MTLKQACLIVAGIAAGTCAAQAGPIRVSTLADGTVEAHVRASDLDLSQDAGARTMWGRIKEASIDVCGESPVLADISGTVAYRQCLNTLETDAVNKLGSTKVAAVSNLKSTQLFYASR